jgi:hypothetical protein
MMQWISRSFHNTYEKLQRLRDQRTTPQNNQDIYSIQSNTVDHSSITPYFLHISPTCAFEPYIKKI